jgi:hypothetical protein
MEYHPEYLQATGQTPQNTCTHKWQQSQFKKVYSEVEIQRAITKQTT